ncbi:unnamed protein product, partial [Brachionus calyciflorus]
MSIDLIALSNWRRGLVAKAPV